jgi:hypothetical protein
MKKNAENAEEYICKQCDFKCCKLSNWTAHTLTRKHQNRTNLNENLPNNATACFKCKKCNKEYKARNSLWYHENKCTFVMETQYTGIIDRLLNDNQRILNENVELRNFIVDHTKTTSETINKTIETIMIQNSETMNKTIETIMTQTSENMSKAIQQNNTTINQTNNNNQRFNINLFLNEECKDAINFADFIKNIQISYEDLENNAQLGFVNGISKIFLDNLKQLGVNERPFHCTDTKRETMYIKDEDKWTKEADDSKLQKAIQTVSYKSMGKLMEWKQENPEYQDVNSDFSKKCETMHKQTLAGSDREVYYPKVIHVLAKETMVDK